jgi:mRNA interferase MazF
MNQGDIYITDFFPSVGREYKKERPAIVISSNNILKESPLITVMPITSNLNKSSKNDVLIKKSLTNHLLKDSLIKVRDIYSFDRKRFKAFIGKIDAYTLLKIKSYIPKHFGLNNT